MARRPGTGQRGSVPFTSRGGRPWLTRKAMEWFWDAYIADPRQRSEITASPNQATIEQLKGLPPTLLLVDEADVLRDEGRANTAN